MHTPQTVNLYANKRPAHVGPPHPSPKHMMSKKPRASDSESLAVRQELAKAQADFVDQIKGLPIPERPYTPAGLWLPKPRQHIPGMALGTRSLNCRVPGLIGYVLPLGSVHLCASTSTTVLGYLHPLVGGLLFCASRGPGPS